MEGGAPPGSMEGGAPPGSMEGGAPPGSGRCREHGQELSWFCYQELRLICPQCRSQTSCQKHKTSPAEERAARIRNKIVDQCEKLQLQTSGIEKYMTDTLPAKSTRVEVSTASAARELVIQRLIFIRNVCDNEEQRLLEEVHTEEERVQQGILTQRSHWKEATEKLSGIRTYLVDMLTKLDDLSLINPQELYKTEAADGILEPQESEKLTFNPGCVQSPLLNRLWSSTVLCSSTELTLDERTLSPLLAVSDGNVLSFFHKKAKNYADEPERFNHWPNCLATASFQSGVHAWKVNVEKSGAYKLGVAYSSVARKGDGKDARLGYNEASWVFSRYDKDFSFSHDAHHQPVELIRSPTHIGVLVDCDGGELIFFDPDSCFILFSHRTKFSAPVYPAFAVADQSIILVK
uniref:B-box and SPRY domain containing n=1 Tax=Leptobrachium leishanense TaxID=445787 RepID=A0A8C5R7A6_9ANUR